MYNRNNSRKARGKIAARTEAIGARSVFEGELSLLEHDFRVTFGCCCRPTFRNEAPVIQRLRVDFLDGGQFHGAGIRAFRDRKSRSRVSAVDSVECPLLYQEPATAIGTIGVECHFVGLL